MAVVRRYSANRADRAWSWIFLIPVIALFLLAAFIPLGYGAFLSLTRFNLTDVNPHPVFIWFQNYAELVSSALFQQTVRNNVFFAVVSVTGELVVGTVVAVMLVNDNRASKLLTTVLLVPFVIAPVAAGTLWRMMLDRTYGVVDWVLGLFGLPAVAWLADYHVAIYPLMLVDIWQFTPFVAVLVLSSVKSIPANLLEAAAIDGASVRRAFFAVVLPLISPILVVVALIRFIDAFKVFGTVFTMTQGGPGNSTMMLSNYIYQEGLGFFRIGLTSAGAIVFVLVMILLSLLFIRFRDYRLGQVA